MSYSKLISLISYTIEAVTRFFHFFLAVYVLCCYGYLSGRESRSHCRVQNILVTSSVTMYNLIQEPLKPQQKQTLSGNTLFAHYHSYIINIYRYIYIKVRRLLLFSHSLESTFSRSVYTLSLPSCYRQ